LVRISHFQVLAWEYPPGSECFSALCLGLEFPSAAREFSALIFWFILDQAKMNKTILCINEENTIEFSTVYMGMALEKEEALL